MLETIRSNLSLSNEKQHKLTISVVEGIEHTEVGLTVWTPNEDGYSLSGITLKDEDVGELLAFFARIGE